MIRTAAHSQSDASGSDDRSVAGSSADDIASRETGYVSFDSAGRLVHANPSVLGFEESGFEDVVDNTENTILTEILDRFADLTDFPLGEPGRLANALAAWQSPGAALAARCPTGKWKLLSNVPRPEGGRIYFVVDTPARGPEQNIRDDERSGSKARFAGEQAEMRARDLLNDAIDSLSEGFALFDVDGTLLMRNQAYRTLMGPLDEFIRPGRTMEEIISEAAGIGFYKAAVGRERAFVEEALSPGEEPAFGYQLERFDGTWLNHRIHPTNLGGGVLTVTDISDRMSREDRAREMLHDAIQSLDEGFALYDADFGFVMSNRKFIQMVHADGVGLVPGRPMIDVAKDLARSGAFVIAKGLTPDEWAERIVEDVSTFSQKLRLTRSDGRQFFGSSHRTGLGGYLITIKEMTDQLRAEQSEREANELLRMIVDACPANFMVSQVDDGKIVYCSPGSRARFGGIETTLSFFLDPKDRLVYLDKLLPTGVLNDYPVRFRRGDGSVMDGLTSARVTRHQGEDVIVSSTRDVTDQLAMQAELARQREISHQNEKLSALGELLAGVAHELNNPLSIIAGYALMLQDKVDEPIMKRRVERIGQAAERCAKIVKTFLAMARQRPARIEDSSLNEVVEIALDVAGYGLRTSGAQVVLDLDPDLPLVGADPDQLAQVFTNLIVNAEHALAGRGQEGCLTLRSFHDRVSGESVIEIRDNGDGIPKELQSRIFEPFFTTKDVGSGTGVGLAFCHRIVVSHGGTLSVRSIPGNGASFFIRLKTLEAVIGTGPNPQSPANEQPKAIDRDYPCGGRRILVVDDEIGVTDLLQDLLEDAGYDVEICNDAQTALDRLKDETFDAIVSDIKMPGIDGREFLERLGRQNPEQAACVAFVTGDSMSPAVVEFLNMAGRPYLEKPIVVTELIAIIEDMCDGPGGDR